MKTTTTMIMIASSNNGKSNLTISGIDTNQGANYKKILRLSYDVIITYDNRKSNLR